MRLSLLLFVIHSRIHYHGATASKVETNYKASLENYKKLYMNSLDRKNIRSMYSFLPIIHQPKLKGN